MPLALQVSSLQRIFNDLNPDVGADVIDWKMQVDETLTMPENRLNLSIVYPQYPWFADETEMKGVKRQALDDLRDMLDYMLTAVPPEAQEDFREVFDDYLSRATYSLDRKLKIAPLKREIATLRERLEEAKKADATPQPPKAPRPPRWTKELDRKLRDVFEATFTREGMSPRRFMPEYRLELYIVKTLTTEDDMVKAVEELAKEIVRREKKPPKIRRIPEAPTAPPPEGDRIHILRPLDEEEEEEEPPGYVPPTTPAFPMEPLSPTPFPRNLSQAERDDIWRAFMDELSMRGIAALTFRKEFNDWLGTFTFKSWPQVREHFESLLEQIQTGKPILFPLHEVMVPWETTEEAVVHFSSIGIYDSMDEMITSLYSYGFDTTGEEVKKIILDQYEKKNFKLMISSKEYLEALINQKLE